MLKFATFGKFDYMATLNFFWKIFHFLTSPATFAKYILLWHGLLALCRDGFMKEEEEEEEEMMAKAGLSPCQAMSYGHS